MECYCSHRAKHPEEYVDIPPGFCGLCDVCCNPGHVQRHPKRAEAGCWCNEHYNELANEPREISWKWIGGGLLALVLLAVVPVILSKVMVIFQG